VAVSGRKVAVDAVISRFYLIGVIIHVLATAILTHSGGHRYALP
jgi:hypothetical protein